MRLSTSLKHLVPGIVIFLLSITGYLASSRGMLVPGPWQYETVQHLGLFPRMSPSDPVWGACLNTLGRLAPADIEVSLCVFSALLGAVTVALVYFCVAASVGFLTAQSAPGEKTLRWLSITAGAVTAVTFAVSPPFLLAVTGAHGAVADQLLLALIVSGSLFYALGGGAWVLPAVALLAGAGVAEFPSLWIILPPLGVALLVAMLKAGDLRAKMVLVMCVSSLAGMLVFYLSARSFFESEGYHLRGFDSFAQVWRVIFRDQYFSLTRSVPKHAWLLSGMLTILPVFAVFLSAKNCLTGSNEKSQILLHVMLTLASLTVLFNVGFTPWALLGYQPLVITPYLFNAVTLGYLVVYWFLLGAHTSTDGLDRKYALFRKGLCFAASLAALLLFAAGCLVNLRDNHSSAAASVNRFCDHLKQDLIEISSRENRPIWLVSDSLIDPVLSIKLASQYPAVRVINTAFSGSDAYMRYLGKQTGQDDLLHLATIGMRPFIGELIENESDQRPRPVLFIQPRTLGLLNDRFLPDRAFYSPTEGLDGGRERAVLESTLDYWKGLGPINATGSRPADLQASGLDHYASVSLNELGVACEDRALTNMALQAYTEALHFNVSNRSARINYSRLIAVTGNENDFASQFDVNDPSIDMEPMSLLDMFARHGSVRDPDALYSLGLQMTRYGHVEKALAAFSDADTIDNSQRDPIRLKAEALLVSGQTAASRAAFENILKSNPRDVPAILGLARVAMAEKDYESAEAYLQEAKGLGATGGPLVHAQAMLLIQQGRFENAKEFLTKHLKSEKEDHRGWMLLVESHYRVDDAEGLRAAISGLNLAGVQGVPLPYAKAKLAILESNWNEARAYLEMCVLARPGNTMLLESLLETHLRLGNSRDSYGLAKKVLALDDRNYLGLRTLGSYALSRGEYGVAEAHLRQSLESRPTPEAMNDLAWALYKLGSLDEAESWAEKAVKINDKFYSAWDTLGAVRLAKGDADGAKTALEMALDLSGGRDQIALHLAEALMASGDRRRAAEVLVEIDSKKLAVDDKRKLKSLLKASQ